jgi:hypothetical protein
MSPSGLKTEKRFMNNFIDANKNYISLQSKNKKSMRVYFWDNANMSGFVGCQVAADWKTTYYIRDAQGNPMATYSRSSQNQEASYKLIERPIYGSSRVGIDNYSLEFIDYTAPTNGITNHVLGLKQYELSNHLGNVLTTISDKKFPIDNNGLIDHYVADITSVSDYYPFGSPMDGRTFGSERYVYGFNGMEAVNENSETNYHYTAYYGEYDTRIIWRWNTDPKPVAWESPYAMFRGNPICYVDPLLDYSKLGAKWRNFINNGTGISYTESTGEWGYGRVTKQGWGIEHKDGLSNSERQKRQDEFMKENTYYVNIGWVKVGSIRTYNPDFFYKWSEDKSILGKITYDFADNWSVTMQNLFVKNFRDGNAYHLNGEMTNTIENVEAFAGISTDLIPATKLTKGLTIFKKINAAQFSKIFKGNLSRLSPSTRGFINRTMNKFVNPINERISTGEVVTDGINLLPKPKKDNE